MTKKLTREEVRQTASSHVYIFGDNLMRSGYGGQAAVCRGEPNCFGVPTKKAPFTYISSYFSDADYEANCKAIRAALALVPRDGRTIVVLEGIGRGLAQLDTRAPKTFQYLQTQLRKLSKG